ncbi:RagB/SusD family nutrient uptake outer membrane protein [Pedobacter sp. ASV28]|uniref:RagB/SusD family nutrient uptake outer membrane protein n=1 Tax=Pedobacter sp. ASV28 TaxID=2795123 RepID=UPI0018ED6FB1|nr:RagB/SusD family nutrient uptake outer membrane protein [Pedobacter sp. ASV28]
MIVKYKVIKLMLLVATVFIFQSCEKYLSTVPDQRAVLDKPEAVSELLVNAYPKANYMPFCEAMSDNMVENIHVPPILSNLQAYKWEDVEATGVDWPINYWNHCYKAIAVANQALKAISEASNPSIYRAQMGEALVARAYAHFMLVTLWAKPYDAASSNSDPGIPYVLEPENVVHKQYERKTVAYVYQQIEKDLLEGMPLISDDVYKKPAFHFTKRAAAAFATRYYLFKKDYAKVIQYADQAFPNNSTVDYLRDWNAYALMGSSVRTQTYNKPSEKANLLLTEGISGWTFSYGSTYRFSVSTSIVYPLTLKSYNNLVNADLAYVTVANSDNNIYIQKLYAHFVSPLNSNLGNYYLYVPLFTAEEVLFNKAEALAMLDRPNEALSMLNVLLPKRVKGTYNAASHDLTSSKVLNHYAGSDIKTAVVNAVLDLKRIEFLHEGLRWLDVLRKGIRVAHPVADKTITGEFNTVLEANDPRRQIQLPPTTVMAGLEPNKR